MAEVLPGSAAKSRRPLGRAAGVLALSLGLSLSLGLGLAACGAQRPAPPDLVLISIDTLRADHVGLYGSERDTTPHIDRFFSRGSVFERAVATAPCTVPSVRQYLTGHLVRDPAARTLAERLRAAGYRTAAIVSQHQFIEAGAWDYARGFDTFDAQGPAERDRHGMTTRTADAVSDRALAWLAQAPRDRPFFLWLHYFDPHDPYEPPERYRGFDAGNTSTRSGDRRGYLEAERGSQHEAWPRAGDVFSTADVEHFRNLYDGEILFTDAEVGRVLDALAERGSVASGVVALLADHGEHLGEGGLWDHCLSLSEAELRVPLLVRDRGGPLGGRERWSEPASTLDLVPTLLALAGLAAGEDAPVGRDWLAAAGPGEAIAQWGPFRALYRDSWKLVTNGRSRRLYDLRTDPAASRNVAREHPDVVAELVARDAARPEQAARVAAETRAELERLRALGYVD